MKTKPDKHLNMMLHKLFAKTHTPTSGNVLLSLPDLCINVESFRTQAQLDNGVTHLSAHDHSHQ